jgi:hypothetical protein
MIHKPYPERRLPLTGRLVDQAQECESKIGALEESTEMIPYKAEADTRGE